MIKRPLVLQDLERLITVREDCNVNFRCIIGAMEGYAIAHRELRATVLKSGQVPEIEKIDTRFAGVQRYAAIAARMLQLDGELSVLASE